MLVGGLIAGALCVLTTTGYLPAIPFEDDRIGSADRFAGEPPAVRIGETDGRWLGAHLLYRRADPAQTVADFVRAVELGEVRSVAADTAKPHFAPMDPRSLWLHLRLHNPAAESRPVWLELRNGSVRYVDLYLARSGQAAEPMLSEQRAGSGVPLDDLGVPHRHPVFYFELPPGFSECYLRISGAAYKRLPLRVFSNARRFSRAQGDDHIAKGLLFGALLSMMVLNALCYLTMRDRSYAALAVFIGAWAITLFIGEGHGRHFAWRDEVWSGSFFLLFNPAASLALITFLRLFLHTRRHTPRLDRYALSAFAGFYLFAIVAYPLLSFEQRVAFGLQVVLPSGLFMAALGFTMGAIAWYRGSSAGRYHTIAGALFMVIGELGYLEVLGVEPANAFLEHGAHIGFLAYVVLLTIGTGQRIQQMKTALQKLNARRQIAELAGSGESQSAAPARASASTGAPPNPNDPPTLTLDGDLAAGRNEWTITPRTEALLKTSLEQIQQRFRESISRETLAAELDWNQDSLGRFFKMYTGERIGDMINRLRVEAAAQALRDSGSRVTEIAFDVGFDSLKTFNRNFVRVMGTTPSEFRKITRLPGGQANPEDQETAL